MFIRRQDLIAGGVKARKALRPSSKVRIHEPVLPLSQGFPCARLLIDAVNPYAPLGACATGRSGAITLPLVSSAIVALRRIRALLELEDAERQSEMTERSCQSLTCYISALATTVCGFRCHLLDSGYLFAGGTDRLCGSSLRNEAQKAE
jgi:hypothetical protein